jgi:hypothetical protein
MPDF